MSRPAILPVYDKIIYRKIVNHIVGGIMVKVYIGKKTQQASITIPKAIVRAKGIRHQQEAEWIIDNLGQLILRMK